MSTKHRVLIAVLISIAQLTCAAVATATEPTGKFAVFKQCPRFTSPVNFCLYTKTAGGEVTIGGFRLPFGSQISIRGGYHRNPETGVETFFGALDGKTISDAPQVVPGGLLGILPVTSLPRAPRKLVEGLIDRGLTGVSATIELAAPASSIGLSTDNLINEEGAGLSLPVRIRLQNPFLGGECYIGSNRNPLELHLTDGMTAPPAPNKPLSGKLGDIKFERELRPNREIEFTEVSDNVAVDNSFSIPGANGCGGVYAPTIDVALDAKLGLPSAPGRNTIVEINQIMLATTEKVIAAEE